MDSRFAVILITAATLACTHGQQGSAPGYPAIQERPRTEEDAPAFLTHDLSRHPEGEGQTSAAARAVVLVTIDGVMWQDAIDDMAQTMPRLASILSTRGTALGGGLDCKGVLQAGNANLSLPGYQEIFTGAATGCRSNSCARSPLPTILDVGARELSQETASISSWGPISRAATNGEGRVVISAGQRFRLGGDPETIGAVEIRETSFPGTGDYRPDARTIALATEYFRTRRPRLLHVGLGDTDEFAHRGNRTRYLDALAQADTFVGSLWEESGHGAEAQLFITSDHGRGPTFRSHGPAIPASRRSWLVALGDGLPDRGNLCLESEVFLTDIAPTIAASLEVVFPKPPGGGSAIALLAAGN